MNQFSIPLAVGGLVCAIAGSGVVGAQAVKKQAAEPQFKRVETKLVEVQKGRVVPNVEAQRLQMVRQLRPFLRAEYHVIRIVCEATPDQRRAIARAGERALRDAAARNPTPGMRIINGQVNPQPLSDPVAMIRDGLARAVKEHLPAEQSARYQDELKRRADTQKQLAVRMLVSTLDQEMLLTEEQRVAIGKSFIDHWDDAWASSLTSLILLQNLQNYFPPIPDSVVVPFLNAAQKEVWQSNASRRRSVNFGFSSSRADDGIEDEELTEAREAEDRQEKKPN